MAEGLFLKETNEYNRDINILDNAIFQSAFYIHTQTKRPLEECIDFVKRKAQEIKPIEIKVLKRQNNGDRIKSKITIDQLLKTVNKHNYILSPNMVVYKSTKEEESFLSKYIQFNMDKRSVVKKEQHNHEMSGDFFKASICSGMQTNIKYKTNSVSGGHSSPHNVLYQKSSHSTLTSTCRVATSYSNATTERFLSGNRHYYNYDTVIENITSIISNTDYKNLENIIMKYNIHVPTVDELLLMIKECSKYYWKSESSMIKIKQYLTNLDSLQKVAYLYTGDFFNLCKYNERLTKTFLSKMVSSISYATNTDKSFSLDETDLTIKNADSDIIALVSVYCADLLNGKTIKDLKKNNEHDYKTLAATILRIKEVLLKFSDLLNCFYGTDNLPSNVFQFPSSIRKNVIGSDTDSTMFTVQNMIEWYQGNLEFNKNSINIGETLCYLVSQVVANTLAIVSKQLGVDDKHLYKLKMKNEFGFRIYMRANKVKHYATLIASKEGNVYKDPLLEIKGVGLKDSKMPPDIMNAIQKEILSVMKGLMNNNGINLFPLLRRVANLEHKIINSLTMAETKYLSKANIKQKSAYKDPKISVYVYHELWEEVFAPLYGMVSSAPYQTFKLSVTINTKRLLKVWIDSLDAIPQGNFNDWLELNTRDSFENLHVPCELFPTNIPKEFSKILDVRKITSQLMSCFYIVLEMCGIYISNDNTTIMLSDEYEYNEYFGFPGDNLYLERFNIKK